MRKLTYTQAATCGENLKVRVTPEQSEKMQLAWFAAGKNIIGCIGKTVTLKDSAFLRMSEKGIDMIGESTFIDYSNEYKEVELIDDLPQHDFASQQEVWMWLGQGKNQVKRTTGDIIGFKSGVLWDVLLDRQCHWQFLDFEMWQKHTPPRLIRVNGVEVPAPLDSLESGKRFWLIDLNDKELAIELSKLDTANEDRSLWLKRGLCCATKEDAIARGGAMLKFEVVE